MTLLFKIRKETRERMEEYDTDDFLAKVNEYINKEEYKLQNFPFTDLVGFNKAK